MLFSGIAAGKLVPVVPGETDVIRGVDVRWEKIKKLTTKAIVDTSKATISANLGERGALTG